MQLTFVFETHNQIKYIYNQLANYKTRQNIPSSNITKIFTHVAQKYDRRHVHSPRNISPTKMAAAGGHLSHCNARRTSFKFRPVCVYEVFIGTTYLGNF